MRPLNLLPLLILATSLGLQPELMAQSDRSDEPAPRAPEVGIASGAFGMRGRSGFAGPAFELRRIQPITAVTSLRARLGITTVVYGRIHPERDIGPLMYHAGVDVYRVLTPRAEPLFLYATFGMTGSIYTMVDKRSGFYLVTSSTPAGPVSTVESAFGPSAGAGVVATLDDRVSISCEAQGMVNLVYPYEPSLGGSVMVGIGWRLP